MNTSPDHIQATCPTCKVRPVVRQDWHNADHAEFERQQLAARTVEVAS